jgi:dihydroorotase
MDILLKAVTVVDPASYFHQQKVDVFLQNGFVSEIGELNPKADEVISQDGLCLSPGFTDVFAHFCDPGFEFRETLESGAKTAAIGGYTDVFLLPNTSPVVHQKSGVEYIVQRSKGLPVRLHPIGAITKNAEGKELAEMYDMQQSGAVAFSDGLCPVQSAGLLLKALQYVKAVKKIIIQVPDDHSIGGHGLMNEGIVSTRLGLPGKPAIAEELMINRDVELARYTGSSLHFTGVSTAKGLSCIREAKAAGLPVSCSVTPAHLYFTDEDLAGYDTNLKLSPPLRTTNDREALRAGVLDGTVDCIASHHLPHHTDHKVVEFEYSKNGMIALETAFAVVRSSLPSISSERLVELFATAPRKLFDLPAATIEPGAEASFSLFRPDREWQPSRFASRSFNSPFIAMTLTGLPYGIIRQDKVFLRPL